MPWGFVDDHNKIIKMSHHVFRKDDLNIISFQSGNFGTPDTEITDIMKKAHFRPDGTLADKKIIVAHV